MTDFVGVDGTRKTNTVNLYHYRGDYAKFTVSHELAAASVQTVTFTVRDSSNNIVIQLDSAGTPTQLYTNGDNEIVVKLLNADTRGEDGGTYNYDVEIIDTSGNYYSPQRGTFTLITDVTYDSSDSAYPSKTKLLEVETDIDDAEALLSEYANFWNGALVTTAALAGASEVVTDDTGDTIFSAGDTMLISLGQGNGYDSVTVASSTAGTVNFAPGTLSAAVSAGYPVRKVV